MNEQLSIGSLGLIFGLFFSLHEENKIHDPRCWDSICYMTPVLSPARSDEVEWEQTLLAVPSANCGSIRSAVVFRAD